MILIQNELRSLLRNCLERFIGTHTTQNDNIYIEIINKLSIRVISSLIAVHIFKHIGENILMRKYITFTFVGYFIFNNYNKISKLI